MDVKAVKLGWLHYTFLFEYSVAMALMWLGFHFLSARFGSHHLIGEVVLECHVNAFILFLHEIYVPSLRLEEKKTPENEPPSLVYNASYIRNTWDRTQKYNIGDNINKETLVSTRWSISEVWNNIPPKHLDTLRAPPMPMGTSHWPSLGTWYEAPLAYFIFFVRFLGFPRITYDSAHG